MRVQRHLALYMLAALLAALVTRPAPATAAPRAQANLVTNGSLESFAGSGVANSWEPWWEEVPNPGNSSLDYALKPTWVSESNPTFVQNGAASQHIGRNWDPWHAGIRQTISVAPGSTVRITAYGRVFASSQDHPAPSESAVQSRMRIGAEPNGSIEWYVSSVRWSGMANPHDTWTQFTLDVTAGASGKVTIFLSVNFRGDSRFHLDAWWDNVSATVIGASGPTSTPASGAATSAPTARPPAAATVFLTPTPGPDGTIIYVVQEGDTLWRIATISGITVDQLKAMNGLTTDFIAVGQRLIIGQASAPAPTETLAPTTDPNALPTAAETAAATQVASTGVTVATGTVCALLWQDANGNGVRDPNEGRLAGGLLTVVDIATGAQVQAYTTDGLSEPHCFTALPAGQYTISSAAPLGYNATTESARALQVEAGSTVSLEFGAQPSASVGEASPTGDTPRWRTALFGAAGVVALLLAAGLAGYLVLRRR